MYQQQKQNSPGESFVVPATAPARFSRVGMIVMCLLFTGCAVAPPTTTRSKPAAHPQFKAGAEHFSGIGMQLGMQDGPLTVVSTLKDSPASKAGLLPGDIIVQINGETAQTMTLPEAVNRIRGASGTSVQLKALRPSTQETKEYSITRIDITYGSGQPNGPDSSHVPTTLPPPSDPGTPF